jgi:hypothetical protein
LELCGFSAEILVSNWSKLTLPKTRKPKIILVRDNIQDNFRYVLSEKTGKNFDSRFVPELSPAEMMQLGVFGGYYMEDCQDEFPKSWFRGVKFSETGQPKAALNYFGVNASQPLEVWQKKGWIYKDDPRGWFQWYCRYYLGRRLPLEDDRQIKRWRAMRRHIGQIKKYCKPRDMFCHRRQRQALLHWAYDSRKI